MASGYPKFLQTDAWTSVYLVFGQYRVVFDQPSSWTREFKNAYCILADEVYTAPHNSKATLCVKGLSQGMNVTLDSTTGPWWRMHPYSRLNENAYAVERCLRSPREACADIVSFIIEVMGYDSASVPGRVCTESFITQLGD